MKFSKKSRYGLRALIDLSVNSETGHVALGCIAERNAIPVQYLEQVFASLRKAGIVKSVKGPQGGYLLNRPAREITAADILTALDGSYCIQEESDLESGESSGMAFAIQTKIIDEVNRRLDEVLQNLTLEDLKTEYLKYGDQEQLMYYI